MTRGTILPSQCKKCKSNVINAIKCKICDSSFHPSCAKLFNGVKFADDSDFTCCNQDNGSDGEAGAFFDAMDELCGTDRKVDINIFKYVVHQKDMLIKELRDKINLLERNINLAVKQNDSRIDSCVDDKNQNHKKQGPLKTANNNVKQKSLITNTQRNKNEGGDSKQNKQNCIQINKKDVALGLMQEETRIKMDTYIHLEDDKRSDEAGKSILKNKPSDADWKTFEKRKNRKGSNILVGSDTSCVAVKGVPKYIALHVYRVERGTSAETLRSALINNFPEVLCESMTPKHPELYSSFKVQIFEQNFKKAMDPSIWPYGTCIGRFLNLTRRTEASVK